MTNRVWKDGTRRAMAYVEGRELAEQVMALTGRRRVEVQDREEASATARRSAAARRQATAAGGIRISAEQAKQDAAMDGAMAVYSDRKGRPFAWQIPFDMGHWDAVTAVIEPEILPALPASPPAQPAPRKGRATAAAAGTAAKAAKKPVTSAAAATKKK